MKTKHNAIPQAAVKVAFLGLLFMGSPDARAKIVERIVAVVNDQIILLSQLESRMEAIPQYRQIKQITDQNSRRQQLEKLKQQLLNHMIDEELIYQEAQKLKITVEDRDLELAVADVMRKNNLTREELENALKEEGSSIDLYKRMILKPQLLRLRVLNVQVRSRVGVSDEEIKARYQQYLRELGVEPKVRASHIFVEVPSSANRAEIEKKKTLVKSILQKVKAGADFAEMARKYSQDSVTRDDGGDLGYFGRGTLPATIEDTVFAMKKGEVRGPLRTDRGYHIIKLTGRQESSAKSLDEVKEELRQQIYAKKLEKATQAWLEEVRKKSFVDIKS